MSALDAFGAVLKLGTTTIGGLLDVEGPSLERKVIDTTNHGSPNGWMQYLPGLKDGGEVTFSVLFDPDDTSHTSAGLVNNLATATAVVSWSLTFSDPTPAVWSFSGFVSKFTPKAPVDGALTADVTIKVSGQPTFA
jgi:hypothetical protein